MRVEIFVGQASLSVGLIAAGVNIVGAVLIALGVTLYANAFVESRS